MRRTMVLVALSLVIIGVYVLPSVTARFAGSHTWELNKTDGVYAFRCLKCHNYIQQEIDASNTWDVVQAHLSASDNTNYIGDDKIINITMGWEQYMGICQMCHAVEKSSIGIYGGHTKITIRACTDGDCHGDHRNPAVMDDKVINVWSQTVNITAKLNSSEDGHSKFYRPLSEKASTYIMEDNTDTKDTTDNATYSAGFYACMGCHTHVGVQMRVQRPQIYNFTLVSQDGTTWSVPQAPNANTTNYSVVNSYGSAGTKWK